ncbi:MAG TPA: RNA pyrophosphohydrolase [Hellea balneolensis]|uniref:RNA pyrophosphohydrolase n=1 Tax=Hellea balneolensis TaxID=287478 RepID=A0A7V5NWS7_9PROT|nr:RNA pyrophosphohydrolase [Hellea balneolensis]
MIRDPDKYRPSAGVVLFGRDGRVWMGRRRKASGPYVWQFPQGGIDKGEKPRAAALRELEEETGISRELVAPLGRIKDWLYYDFPDGFKGAKAARGWQGQRQKWYAYQFLGQDSDVNLKAHRQVEFSDWRWDDLARAPLLVVPFKRDVYAQIVRAFSHLAQPQANRVST